MTENTENKILEKLEQIDQRLGGVENRLSGVEQRLIGHDAQFERIVSLVLDNNEQIAQLKAELDTKVSREEFLQAHDELMQHFIKHDQEIVAINSRSDDYVTPAINKIPRIERDVAQLKAHAGIV